MKFFYVLFFGFTFSFNALSSGVPTADALTVATMIAENLKAMEKQAEQITQLKDQLEQMKKQAQADVRRFEGNLGNLLNTDSMYSILGDNLNDILSSNGDLSAMRDKYGLKTEDKKLQEAYDAEMKKLVLLEENFKASAKRTNDLKNLKDKALSAKTPTEKQDIANEIAYQQAQMQNEAIKLEQVRQAQEQSNRLKMKSKNKAHSDAVSSLINERWK